MILAVSLLLAIPPGPSDKLVVNAAPDGRIEVWDPIRHTSNITDLSLTPPNQFLVVVNVTGAGLINGFDVTLRYDLTGPGVLDALAGSLGGGLFDPDNPPSASCSVFVAKQDVDIPQGQIRFAAVFFGNCSVGDGTLFSVIFDVKNVGATSIDIIPTDQSGGPATQLARSGVSVPYQPVSAYFRNKPGIPPVATFTFLPSNPLKGDTVYFNATLSYDPNNSTTGVHPNNGIKTYRWFFGDGTAPVAGPLQNHVFIKPVNIPAAGSFSVTLLVTDFNDDLPGSIILVVPVTQAEVHDIAVQVSTDKTQYQVGETVKVTAIVSNRGNREETANVTVTYDFHGNTVIGREYPVGLQVIGTTTAQTFTYQISTSGLSARTYTITGQGQMVDTVTGRIVTDAKPLDNTNSVSFTLIGSSASSSSSLSLPVLAGSVVVILVAAWAVLYVLRRRRKEE